MYKLFTDKAETFECDIQIEGASLSNSSARLVVETKDYSLMFDGDITSSGKCTIPIRKLKGLIEEDSEGTIRLEVIAEDTYFTPWESEFKVKASKKVTVEVKSQNDKTLVSENKVKVTNIKNGMESIEVNDSEKKHVINLLKLLVKEDININNLHLKKDKVNKIIATYTKHKPFPEESTSTIINGLVEGLNKISKK